METSATACLFVLEISCRGEFAIGKEGAQSPLRAKGAPAKRGLDAPRGGLPSPTRADHTDDIQRFLQNRRGNRCGAVGALAQNAVDFGRVLHQTLHFR